MMTTRDRERERERKMEGRSERARERDTDKAILSECVYVGGGGREKVRVCVFKRARVCQRESAGGREGR